MSDLLGWRLNRLCRGMQNLLWGNVPAIWIRLRVWGLPAFFCCGCGFLPKGGLASVVRIVYVFFSSPVFLSTNGSRVLRKQIILRLAGTIRISVFWFLLDPAIAIRNSRLRLQGIFC